MKGNQVGHTSLVELQRIAVEVATRAADLAAFRRAQGVEVAASKTAPEDIVTHADREVEALIRAAIAEARPDDGFVGEESDAGSGRSGLTWVVDPIDGTVNYLYGLAPYTVSIAVVEGDADPASWRPLAGAVVNIVSKELYYAAAGHGSFLNGRRLAVRRNDDLSQSLVATGFSYDIETRVRQAEVVVRLLRHVRDIRRIGSASHDLCSIAAGRLDVYFERGLFPWDHAAGGLIAGEAGANVVGFEGAPAGQDFLIAGNPGLVAQLEPLLRGWYEAAGFPLHSTVRA